MAQWREFYATAPRRAIALDELEHAALLRLRVLRVLLAAPSSDRLFRVAQDLPEAARDAIHLLDGDVDLDCVAHYALRLAFCADLDRLEWLVDAESRLMSLRLRALSCDAIIQTLEKRGHEIRVYKAEEIGSMVSAKQSEWLRTVDCSSSRYCRVPFQQAARLVGHRRVLVENGRCWLPERLVYHVGVFHFRKALRMQMTALHRSLPAKQLDMERLTLVIDHIYADSMRILHTSGTLSNRSRNTLVLTRENIDDVAEKHFPPCMKHLHRKMRQNHHLKFDGRVQYRVFLKGLGFSVHDNILFFRNEFTKVLPPAKFDREYVYHIRHSYGLEGSRKDYAPMDCEKIIHGAAPRHGQYHGCPFKHWDTTTLHSEIRRMGVRLSEAEAIARTASQGHHQRACTCLFDALHPQRFSDATAEGDEDGARHMHPNQWVVASVHACGS